MPKDFASGLPSKEKIHDINQQGPTRLVIQKHTTTRSKGGYHYDVRLHAKDSDKTHSWVVRSLPGEKKTTLAIRQPTHRAEYSDFEGTLWSGYGAGKVKKVYDQPIHVHEATNEKIKMTMPEGEFVMIKPKTMGEKHWLMIKKKDQTKQAEFITSKPKYKILSEPTDYSDNNKVLQGKVDGAHAIIHLKSDQDNHIYSYRNSKRTGEPIDHSDQVPDLKYVAVPKKFDDTVLRGELYATKNNKPVAAEVIGGMLNASIQKSLEKQKEHGKLKPYIFDIVKFKGEDVSQEPYRKKLELMESVEKRIPSMRVAETAFTSEQKRKLVNSIKKGLHPETKEGVVEWDLSKPTGAPAKLKYRDNFDVYIRKIFPAISKATGKEKDEAGGFEYSLTPKGKIVGNVGTGFTQAKRKDMLENPKDYLGMVARVKSQQQFSSGALRAPAFYTMDVEKNLEKTSESEQYNIENDLAKLKLHKSVYSPAFNKAEGALMSGVSPEKYKGNEWNYAIDAVNKSQKLRAIEKKYGKKINIIDTGSSEDNWKYKLANLIRGYMPFSRDAQRKFMFAKHPKIAKRWAKHTPNIKDLPEHVEKKAELVQCFEKLAAIMMKRF